MKKTDRYAVVTGASTGLGREIALTLARKGVNTVLISLPGENLYKVADECRKCGTDSAYIETDLTKMESVRETVRRINDNYKVFVLINNAGFGGSSPFSRVSADYISSMILLNASATVLMTRGLLQNLLESRESYILNISSMASLIPSGYKTVYPASKAFVRYFSVGLRQEMKGTGLSVSVAIPGPMETKPEIIERIHRHKHSGKLLTIPLHEVAGQCVNGMFSRKRVIVIGIVNKISFFLLKCVPEVLAAKIMTNSVRKEFSPGM